MKAEAALVQDSATKWLWTYNNDQPNMVIDGITLAMKLKMASISTSGHHYKWGDYRSTGLTLRRIAMLKISNTQLDHLTADFRSRTLIRAQYEFRSQYPDLSMQIDDTKLQHVASQILAEIEEEELDFDFALPALISLNVKHNFDLPLVPHLKYPLSRNSLRTKEKIEEFELRIKGSPRKTVLTLKN